MLYCKQGRYVQAEQFLRQALTICERRLGAEHPHTARSLHELAKLYSIQRRYTEADSLFQRALTIREQKLGADHPDTLATRERYAAL
jgi:tetratricopeptide (TPR) repeat protein